MRLQLALSLPRDSLSIPVSRQILRRSLDVLGTTADCADDIEVALTEACTNVLDHAPSDAECTLSVTVDDDRCTIDVVDAGAGFNEAALEGSAGEDDQRERGRGLLLIRALVDAVRFDPAPTRGMVVHIEKALAWRESSPVRQLQG